MPVVFKIGMIQKDHPKTTISTENQIRQSSQDSY